MAIIFNQIEYFTWQRIQLGNLSDSNDSSEMHELCGEEMPKM